ncbi:MAG: NAD(+) synthase [Clostridiales Family XIII bacterium]|jgi:NAD+ synthase (glutamine-hydrolysing)|nr:NAD(+) synthase [Clostridiales Family XIII bacterium]
MADFAGFVTVAAVSPRVSPGNCALNTARIIETAEAAAKSGAKVVVFPELSVTGYTCGDLFLQDKLLSDALGSLKELAEASRWIEAVILAGLPFIHRGKLYNVCAAVKGGEVLGLVPKSHIPNYGEYYELRHFIPAFSGIDFAVIEGRRIPFGTDLLFRCRQTPELTIAVEICEDLWAPQSPAIRHAEAGATVIANLSAGDETVGKDEYRRVLIRAQSGRLICAYIYANAGFGESTGDMTFSGHSMICENASILSERKPFEKKSVIADIDLKGLLRDRRYQNTFDDAVSSARPKSSENCAAVRNFPGENANGVEYAKYAEGEENAKDPKDANCIGEYTPDGHLLIDFSMDTACVLANRHIAQRPFVPGDLAVRARRCEEIIAMQSSGLAKRLGHIRAKKAVIGVSGGLDSTLALLITVRAMRQTGGSVQDILAVTMPGPGTTEVTKNSAERLCEALGVEVRRIPITESVELHLRDIGHPEGEYNNAYENAQARMRTMILMNLANENSGIVVGTGDLSELAMGWATYNGDHMSMYGVNAGVPKTLVRYLIEHFVESAPELKSVLEGVLETPVSPELLPPINGEISQKTEDIIGPYELHDFFLYHMIRWGRDPKTVYALALKAFDGVYPETVIRKFIKLYYRRFFTQQFKRSALPDGPKIGSVTLSPRSDWRMPSDADGEAWMAALYEIDQQGK